MTSRTRSRLNRSSHSCSKLMLFRLIRTTSIYRTGIRLIFNHSCKKALTANTVPSPPLRATLGESHPLYPKSRAIITFSTVEEDFGTLQKSNFACSAKISVRAASSDHSWLSTMGKMGRRRDDPGQTDQRSAAPFAAVKGGAMATSPTKLNAKHAPIAIQVIALGRRTTLAGAGMAAECAWRLAVREPVADYQPAAMTPPRVRG